MLTHPDLSNLRVVLVSTRNPLNIGAAARALSNFGGAHLRLVTPYDPAYREARSAVGASSILAHAEEFKSVAAAVADCTLVVGTTAVGHRELHHPLQRLEPAARLILHHLAQKKMARQKLARQKKSPAPAMQNPNRVALLFGSEKTGLSNDDMSYCHWLLHIPTSAQHISMNLGQAVAVCLYELIRHPSSAHKPKTAPQKDPPATAGEIARFTAILTEALTSSGFLTLRTVADSDQRIRRLVRRLHLPSRDADMWTGIMRQIVWKLHSTEGSPPRKKQST